MTLASMGCAARWRCQKANPLLVADGLDVDTGLTGQIFDRESPARGFVFDRGTGKSLNLWLLSELVCRHVEDHAIN
jgi:hypothetical protein